MMETRLAKADLHAQDFTAGRPHREGRCVTVRAMYRLLFLAAGALASSLASCGTIECDDSTYTCTGGGDNGDGDDRPLTLEYVVVTVLRPNCANAQCHSSFKYEGEYRFDTVEHTQQSLAGVNGNLVIPGDAEASLLFNVLIRETQSDGSGPRMPYDQPLPTAEIALIKEWINQGADGLVVSQ